MNKTNVMANSRATALFISRLAVVLIVLGMIVQPLCDSAPYYLMLIGVAIVPLAFGTKHYRIFAVIAILVLGCAATNAYMNMRRVEAETKVFRERARISNDARR